VCKEPILLFYPIFIPLALCVVNGIVGLLPGIAVAWAMGALALAQELLFAIVFISQVAGFLHIKPFSIPHS
jgi:hypothetical protein